MSWWGDGLIRLGSGGAAAVREGVEESPPFAQRLKAAAICYDGEEQGTGDSLQAARTWRSRCRPPRGEELDGYPWSARSDGAMWQAGRGWGLWEWHEADGVIDNEHHHTVLVALTEEQQKQWRTREDQVWAILRYVMFTLLRLQVPASFIPYQQTVLQ